MLVVTVASGSDIFEFSPAEEVLVYINENDNINVRIASIVGKKLFYMEIQGQKRKIDSVNIVAKDMYSDLCIRNLIKR